MLMEECDRALKIIHLEDNAITLATVKNANYNQYKNVELIQHKTGIRIYMDLAFEKPDIIIVDWNLPDMCASILLKDLKRFKGLVIFFTASHDSIVYTEIKKQLYSCPENFLVISKAESGAFITLMRDIKNHAESLAKNIYSVA